VYKSSHYDHEDDREYSYEAKFDLNDFRWAVRQLYLGGKRKVIGVGGNLEMEKVNEKGKVEMKFSGTPFPCSTPGGASLSGSILSSCELSDLLNI
jgi:hypothetical protein